MIQGAHHRPRRPDKAQRAEAQWASLCARQLNSSSRPGEHRHLRTQVLRCPHSGVSAHLGTVRAPLQPACRESAPVVRAPARLPRLVLSLNAHFLLGHLQHREVPIQASRPANNLPLLPFPPLKAQAVRHGPRAKFLTAWALVSASL